MKRILSILLSVVLIVTSLSVGLVAVAKTIPHENGLDVFANNLFEMIRRHDNSDSEQSADSEFFEEVTETFPIIYTEQMYGSYTPTGENNESTESVNDDCKSAKDFGLPENAFDLNRLIVKSDKRIDYHGAIECVSGYRDLYVLQYGSLEATISAYEYYLSLDTIEYVEPDLVYFTQKAEVEIVSPSDDLTVKPEDFVEIVDKIESWNTKEIGFDTLKDKLSEVELEEVVVAVMDSGIDTDHEMFEGRLIENFVNCSASGAENSVEDDYGHGTHVAGIIVDNTLSNVKIKPYKVLNYDGKGSLSSIVVAIDLAVEHGVDIINMSLTADGYSQAMTDSVNAAVEKGINVVVAAGNKGADLSKKTYTPACIESAITVSAVTKDHKLSSYSNYNGPIDIAAPGDNIISAYLNNTYVSMSGTSMAAPQVAAGIALVRSIYKEKTNIEAEEFLEEYAITMQEDNTNKFGSGILYLKYILEDTPRTVEPIFSVESGEFLNSFKLSINCYEKDSKVFYIAIEEEFDGEYDDEEIFNFNIIDADIYESPIAISLDTTVAAIAKADGKNFSSVVVMEYDRRNICDEDLYDIDNSGMITGYVGTDTDLVIPDKVQGKAVKGIGYAAFKDNEDIHSVILPSTATHIGVDAFKNCTNLESVMGASITHVNLNAFYNSSISEFSFEKVKIIGDKAFYGCKNLENVDLSNVEKIGVSSFENATGISEINNEKLTTIGNNAFKGTQVTEISLPNVKTVGTGVFEKCLNLVSVSIPLLESVSASLFKNCTSLSEIDLPNITSISNNAFQGVLLEAINFENVETVGNYAFRESLLKYAFLPCATDIGTGCFMNCPNLKFVYLQSLKEVNGNTFSKCDLLKSVWLPSVETVNKNAFNNSLIEYLQFDKVTTINSLPETLLGIVLPSSLVSVTASIPETEFKVYGYENTFAHQFAIENSKEFLPVPAMICETPENVSIDEKYIFTYALGFNCTYQWYKNDTVSNENGTPIENANSYWYEPKKADNAVCYYCLITSDDGVNHSEVVTSPITNVPEYQEADFTAYNSVVDEAAHIDRDLYTDESLSRLDELLALDVSNYSLAEQDTINQLIEDIKTAISSLSLNYVLGDVNSDGKISLLDARLTLKTVSGTEELDRIQTLSADMNEDGKISLVDVRAILRLVSETAETE